MTMGEEDGWVDGWMDVCMMVSLLFLVLCTQAWEVGVGDMAFVVSS